MDEVNGQFKKQNDIIDDLTDKMRSANMVDKIEINDKIKAREKELDVLRRQVFEVEKLYKKRDSEANKFEFKVPGSGSSGSGSGSSSGGGGNSFSAGAITSALGGAISKIGSIAGTVGKFTLGLAGLGSLMSMATDAYQIAYQRQVGSLDLAQRIRGYSYNGSAVDMYKQAANTGRRSNMGYTESESWALQDAYSSRGGALGANQQYGLQMFSRGYGLDSAQVGSSIGGIKQLGGVTQPKEFADMIAGSVSQSGMLPRIMEVMQAHTSLLSNINTTFKDGSSSQILAYQTTLDRIGNENGMTKLTGQQGANVISGLNGIFQPDNDKWQWMGMSALQKYNPGKYGGMGLYDLQSSFEDGLQNGDNLPAMAQELKQMSGGNNDIFKRMMQSWLQDGGFNATKSQVTELDKVTNGFSAFDKTAIDSVMSTNAATDSGAKYTAERQDEYGQHILDVEANFDKALGDLGEKFLPIITDLKEGATGILNELNDHTQYLDKILEGVLGIAAIVAISSLAGGASSLLSKLFKKGGGSGAAGEAIEATTAEASAAEKAASGYTRKDLEEIGVGRNGKAGALTDTEVAKLKELSGGDTYAQGKLEQLYRATGDMESVEYAASGKAMPSDLIDMMARGDKGASAKLSAYYEKTGDLAATIDKGSALSKGVSSAAVDAESSSGLLSKLLGGGKKVLGFGSKVLGGGSLLGGAIELGTSLYSGEGLGRSASKAGGTMLGMAGGGMAGGSLGTMLGGGIGALFGGVGAIPGAAIGGFLGELLGSVGGGMAGSQLGGGLYDSLSGSNSAASKQAATQLQDFAQKGTLDISGLNTEGLAKLEELKSQGLLSYTDLAKNGKLQITNLSTEGATSLLSLQKKGDVSLISMDNTTATKLAQIRKDSSDTMDDIYKEHKNMSATTTGFFDNFWNAIKGFLGITSPGSSSSSGGSHNSGGAAARTGGSSITADTDVRGNTNSTTAGALNSLLGGKLAGHGQDFMDAGAAYNIDPSFLAAVSMHETGNGSTLNYNNPAGLMRGSGGLQSFDSLAEGISAEAKNLGGSLYVGDGLTTPATIQPRYCPVGADNDNGSNKDWLNGVTKFWQELQGASGEGQTAETADSSGIYAASDATSSGTSDMTYNSNTTGDASNAMNGGTIFNGWANHINSAFGATAGRDHAHGGIDLAAAQGTAVDALQGGTLAFLDMDDGGTDDPDGKANSQAGGTDIGVTMADGKTYLFYHMSGINPDLLSRYKQYGTQTTVSQGEWLGNSGGTPGVAGSGYSTTGEHLHIGYEDASGNLLNPADLLNANNIGDGDRAGTYTAVSAADAAKSTGSGIHVTVDVNLKGDGVSNLNTSTAAQLKNLINQAIQAYEAQKLAMNPTVRG